MIQGKVLIDGKHCSKCGVYKTAGSFHKDKTSPTGLAYYCKECANSSARENHNKRSRDAGWVAARREYQKSAARSSKERAVAYLGGSCQDCGKTYKPYIYDFHHLDGTIKSDNPSRLLRGSWEEAKLELDKCVLLCSNCHRERHYG